MEALAALIFATLSIAYGKWNLQDSIDLNRAILYETLDNKPTLTKITDDLDSLQALHFAREILQPGEVKRSDVSISLIVSQTKRDQAWLVQVFTNKVSSCSSMILKINGQTVFAAPMARWKVRKVPGSSAFVCETWPLKVANRQAVNDLLVEYDDKKIEKKFLLSNEIPRIRKIVFETKDRHLKVKIPNFQSQALVKSDQRKIMLSILENEFSAPVWSTLVNILPTGESSILLDTFNFSEGTLENPKGDKILRASYLEISDNAPVQIVRQFDFDTPY